MLSGASQISSLLSLESLIWVFGCHVPGLVVKTVTIGPRRCGPWLPVLVFETTLPKCPIAWGLSNGHASVVGSSIIGQPLKRLWWTWHWPLWDMGLCMKGHIPVPLKPLITETTSASSDHSKSPSCPITVLCSLPRSQPKGDVHLCRD